MRLLSLIFSRFSSNGLSTVLGYIPRGGFAPGLAASPDGSDSVFLWGFCMTAPGSGYGRLDRIAHVRYIPSYIVKRHSAGRPNSSANLVKKPCLYGGAFSYVLEVAAKIKMLRYYSKKAA